jgi:hypothetical protein
MVRKYVVHFRAMRLMTRVQRFFNRRGEGKGWDPAVQGTDPNRIRWALLWPIRPDHARKSPAARPLPRLILN